MPNLFLTCSKVVDKISKLSASVTNLNLAVSVVAVITALAELPLETEGAADNSIQANKVACELAGSFLVRQWRDNLSTKATLVT